MIQQDVLPYLQMSRVTGSAHDHCSGRQAGMRRLRKLASLVCSAILWAEVDERGGRDEPEWGGWWTAQRFL